MESIMIFGAGQAGGMVTNYISNRCEIIGFIDNNKKLWGTYKYNKKIYSIDEAIEINPDIIIITVLKKEVSKEIEKQLELLNYKGKVFNINDIKPYIDIRLAFLRLLSLRINEQELEGEVAELGVYKGDFAREINKLFPNKKLYLFDTFEGFCSEDVSMEKEYGYSKAKQGDFSDTNIEIVKDKLIYKENAVFIKGYFPNSIKEDLPKFCFVSLDTDLYNPTYEGLKVFYPKLVKGGAIIIHDYNSTQFLGVRKAVKKFCRENNINTIDLCDLHGSTIIVK